MFKAKGDKIKVGIVNYLNTKPLLYGLERDPVSNKIELIGDYPSKIADWLMDGTIDIGLVPVAILPKLTSYSIVGNCCIGTEGEIASVALFSEVPMSEIRRVYLDYQSKTSVALLKYLLSEYWAISPELIDAKGDDYRENITGTSAGLVIGDRAFQQRKISTFIYDLGSEWKAITGLPFVFAVWASLSPLPDAFVEEFNQANLAGLSHITEIARAQHFELYDLNKYYNLHLSYILDERKKKAMELFLKIVNHQS